MEVKLSRRKRRINTVIAMTQIFLIGIELSSMESSLLFYLQNQVRVDHPHFYYGIIMASSFVSGFIGALIFGRYADKTRKIKFVLLVNVGLVALGNLIYTVSLNVWFLILGRFLTGFAESLEPIMSGEFNRIYTKEEVLKILSNYQLAFGVGHAIGPLLAMIFKGVHFVIITSVWEMSEDNVFGFNMSFLNCLVGILVVFAYTDVEQGIQCDDFHAACEELCNQNIEKTENKISLATDQDCSNWNREKRILHDENDGLLVRDNPNEISSRAIFHESELLSFKDLFQFDILTIVISSAVAEASSVSLEIVVFMIANTTFKWSLTQVLVIYSASMIAACILIGVISLKKGLLAGKLRVYVAYLICLFLQSLMLVITWIPIFVSITTFWQQAIFFVSLVALSSAVYFALMVISKMMLFHIVPKHSSSFADGFKTSASMLLLVVCLCFSSSMYFHGAYASSPILLILFISILTLLSRRDKYLYK